MEVFNNESSIVFTMWNSKKIQAEIYAPQPSFARTKPILPILRILGDRTEEVSPLSYSVDFDCFLEEAIELAGKRGYEGLEKKFEAWIKEIFAMSKCFDVSNGNDIDIKDFIITDNDMRSFKAWVSFFFVLSRYILSKEVTPIKKEKTDYFTHLEYADFKSVFMKSLGELELEREQAQEVV